MNTPQSPPSDADHEVCEQSEGRGPFSATTLARHMAIDSAVWWAFRLALLVLFVLVLIETTVNPASQMALSIFFILFVGSWLVYSLVSARVARQLPRITELIEFAPDEAETLLRNALGHWPLQRAVRLLLYHRLAMLRRRTDHFVETSMICEAVLSYPLGLARQVTAHLLLLLTEARLQCQDLWGAWSALNRLHRCRLNLIESLQLLALQTRYEVEAGYDTEALFHLDQKIAMAELMPAAQCGAFHAIAATAAWRIQRKDTAQWLRRRAELLCSAEELKRLWPAGAFDGNVVMEHHE